MTSIGTGLTLLLGGARSGKSDLSVELGEAWAESHRLTQPVLFVATAEALDADMSARIDRHRLERPAEWQTVEQPLFGANHVAELPSEPLLILDCLTLLVSNLLFAEHAVTQHVSTEHAVTQHVSTEQAVTQHVSALSRALAERSGPSIVVSNEVGMGIVPDNNLSRTYRDELGRANRIVADAAATALLIVAGRALPLTPVTWSFE